MSLRALAPPCGLRPAALRTRYALRLNPENNRDVRNVLPRSASTRQRSGRISGRCMRQICFRRKIGSFDVACWRRGLYDDWRQPASVHCGATTCYIAVRHADIFINIFSVLLVYTYVCSKVASGSRNIINIKNCSLSVVLTATEQRPQNH